MPFFTRPFHPAPRLTRNPPLVACAAQAVSGGDVGAAGVLGAFVKHLVGKCDLLRATATTAARHRPRPRPPPTAAAAPAGATAGAAAGVGGFDLSEAAAVALAREILTLSNRTETGGDTYFCIDSLLCATTRDRWHPLSPFPFLCPSVLRPSPSPSLAPRSAPTDDLSTTPLRTTPPPPSMASPSPSVLRPSLSHRPPTDNLPITPAPLHYPIIPLHTSPLNTTTTAIDGIRDMVVLTPLGVEADPLEVTIDIVEVNRARTLPFISPTVKKRSSSIFLHTRRHGFSRRGPPATATATTTPTPPRAHWHVNRPGANQCPRTAFLTTPLPPAPRPCPARKKASSARCGRKPPRRPAAATARRRPRRRSSP